MKKRAIGMMGVLLSTVLVLSSCGTTSSTTNNKKVNFQSKLTETVKATSPSKVPASAKKRKDTLVVGVVNPEGKFNEQYGSSQYDIYIDQLIFGTLGNMDEEGNPTPGIAKSWKISDDGLTYTFNLRDDVKFTDGNPVTSDDVELSYLIGADKSYDGVADYSSCYIKGFQDYHDGKATSITGIEKPDKHTIVFKLDKPNASNIYSFCKEPILEKAYYGKDYKQGDTKSQQSLLRAPIGCGPYKFVKFVEGQETDLVANDNYYQGKPKIKNLIFKTQPTDTKLQAIIAGDTDIDEMPTANPQTVDQLKQAGFVDIQMFPDNVYGYIDFNLKKNPAFADVKVRQALTYGLDRKTIVNTVYQGYAEVCNEPCSSVSWGYTKDIDKYEYNVDKAKKLLDEAGWKVGSDGMREKDGKKLEIRFSGRTPDKMVDALIPIMEKNYKELGVKVTPETMDFNAQTAKFYAGNYEMIYGRWGLNADPDCTTLFKTGSSQNTSGYSNPTVDKLIDEGLQQTTQEKRKPVYAKLFQELNKDLPYIYLSQTKAVWAVSSRVKGINITPFKDFTYSLWNAEIK